MYGHSDSSFDSQLPNQPSGGAMPPLEDRSKKKKKGWTPVRIAALALCCTLLGACIGVGGFLLGPQLLRNAQEHSVIYQGVRESTVLDIAQIDTSKVMTPAEVYAANVNSTVGITTSTTTNFWGFQTTSAASGSGFIITPDGYILTNHHVIQNADSVTVALYDGTTYDATVVGYDASNDLAVLKVDAQDLSPVVIGDSDNLNVGDSVVAIGNPLGELTFSLTSGTVSALNREVTFSGNRKMDLIQTDCAINSGNSGGALFNLYGEVIGITNAKYSSSGGEASIDNIGFAIPIKDVGPIVTSIIEKGYISRPYIGISVTDVSADAIGYGLPKGAAVAAVAEGSPAEKAGILENDIITNVNGTEIPGSNELVEMIGQCEAGDKLQVQIYRQGQIQNITVVVEETVQPALEEEEPQQSSQSVLPFFPGFPWGSFFG